MKRHNLQSIFFATIILFFVWWSRPHQSLPEELARATANEQISVTSIAPTTVITLPNQATAEAAQPNIQARAAVVKELGNVSAAFRRNTSQRWPIASLTKLMTAVVAMEKFSTDQKIFFSAESIATEGAAGGFQISDTIPVYEVIKSLMMVSSNDGAMALAETYGYKNFMETMQAKAVELGMVQTTFADPTGLSFLNQSTIDDLERLIAYVLSNHPQILQMSTVRETAIAGRPLVNINAFAGRPDFIGGKTGHTDDARQNLISLFRQADGANKQPILIIVLGSDDRFGETEKLWQAYKKIELSES